MRPVGNKFPVIKSLIYDDIHHTQGKGGISSRAELQPDVGPSGKGGGPGVNQDQQVPAAAMVPLLGHHVAAAGGAGRGCGGSRGRRS